SNRERIKQASHCKRLEVSNRNATHEQSSRGTIIRGQMLWPGMAAATAGFTMIKSTLTFIAILSLLAATSAFAKTLKLPGDEFPIASIAFPDDWAPEEVTNGVAGQSPDTAVYLAAVAVGSEKGMNAELEDTFAMLEEHKVELDKSTKKENKFKLNGV